MAGLAASGRSGEGGPGDGGGRLLPWIAAERALRAIVLLAVGVVLVTHPHADWAHEATRLARKLGMDPQSNWVQRIVHDLRKVHTSENTFFGVVALAYGVLEGFESYGLWHRRRWGEWLTVLATSLLLVPEAWELSKSASVLKVGALVLNLAIVLYLLVRMGVLGRREQTPRRGRATGASVG